MPFYRFEDFDNVTYFAPRLSTAQGPIIEGQFMYFCLVNKELGTGSQVHYHPNELLIFPLNGKINALVGRERRIVSPGTFIHIPPFGRHQMVATEDQALSYIYVKDKTWTLTGGIAEEEALPERGQTLEEALEEYKEAEWIPGKGEIRKTDVPSAVRIDGLGTCFYPILRDFNDPVSSGNRQYLVEGQNLTFCYSECLADKIHTDNNSPHEMFIYVILGSMDVVVNDEQKTVEKGDIIHIPLGSSFRMVVTGGRFARYVSMSSIVNTQEKSDRS